MSPAPCPLCDGTATEIVHRATAVPFANVNTALAEFAVSACRGCGFVFQSSAYTPAYDDVASQVYADYVVNRGFQFPERSPKHLVALNDLLAHLPENSRANVLELGSNRGDFLYLLKEARPGVSVLGIEPTRFAEPLTVPTITSTFAPQLFANQFDVIVLKHVLEHIKSPRTIIQSLRQALTPDGLLYIEVPDLERSLDQGVEDFIPDHVNYFSAASLTRLLAEFDIILCEVRNFLHVMARPKVGGTPALATVTPDAEIFRRFATWSHARTQLLAELKRQAAEGADIVFYGSGFYFARLYKELAADLRPGRGSVVDDNAHWDNDPTFGLPRARSVSDSALVVLCTNNAEVQAKMAGHLKSSGFAGRILKPWSGFVT